MIPDVDALTLSFEIMKKSGSYSVLKQLHLLSGIKEIVGYSEFNSQEIIREVANYIICIFQKISLSVRPFNSTSNFLADLNQDSFIVNRLNEYFPIPHYLGIQIVSRIRFLAKIDIFPYLYQIDNYLPPQLVCNPQYDQKLIKEIQPWFFSGRSIKKRYIRLLTASFYYANKEIVKDNIFFDEEKLCHLLESPLLFVLFSVYNLRPELIDDILKN